MYQVLTVAVVGMTYLEMIQPWKYVADTTLFDELLIPQCSFVSSLQLDKSLLLADPWEATLIPTEPDPTLFDSYKDYEAALQRWAILCSRVDFVPPHAYQLADVIPIAVPVR